MQPVAAAPMKVSLQFAQNLDTRNNVIAEYVWIDGSGEYRSKARTLAGISKINTLEELPDWNFDGSSCYMAVTDNSEIMIKPVAFFPDPFRGGNHIIVMTETFNWVDGSDFTELQPANSNFRHFAKPIWDAAPEELPWYGIEQEYTLLEEHNRFTTTPYGWPKGGFPGPQGPYYCSAGANTTFGRSIADAHYKCCLYAGVKISGINAEVMPGQWEY
jgi:glutamine synthetase